MSIEQSVTLLTRDANRTAEEVERLRADMNGRFDAVDQRFDRLEERFDRLEGRFDELEERFDRLEERVERLEIDVRQIIQLLQNKTAE